MRHLCLIALASSLLLSACTSPVSLSASQRKEAMESITYSKDPRTDLCFAVLGSMGDSGFIKSSITYVPCTPAVLAQIK